MASTFEDVKFGGDIVLFEREEIPDAVLHWNGTIICGMNKKGHSGVLIHLKFIGVFILCGFSGNFAQQIFLRAFMVIRPAGEATG